MKQIKGWIVDVLFKKTFPGAITIADGKLLKVEHLPETDVPQRYIMPGFVDAHIHIESSMLAPSEFAKIAVQHGTVATVSDPHEIANVCGVEGVNYMIANGKTTPFKFNFGAPSCVPATAFETAGAVIDSKDIEALLQRDDIKYLAEMMNFPGVLFDDAEVMKKLEAAHKYGKPVDGHAPGLRGKDIEKYCAAGISTDHECVALDEGQEKADLGMKILIREGSAAKNFNALIPLLKSHPSQIMFCSDDKHPDDLLNGHINELVVRALAEGCNLFDTLYAACVHPIVHYKLDVGYLQEGQAADFIIVENLTDFKVMATYIDGVCVYQEGKTLFETEKAPLLNQFDCEPIRLEQLQFALPNSKHTTINVIEALDGQLITNPITYQIASPEQFLSSIIADDILKIVVVNRYQNAPVAIGFIKNFGLKKGALASTVAHDSHNIVAVGANDDALCKVINDLIATKGGIAVYDEQETHILPLPIAGLMTNEPVQFVGQMYSQLTAKAKDLGATLHAPFMTLSFMALPVIPALKMTDKGLFNVTTFNYEPVIVAPKA